LVSTIIARFLRRKNDSRRNCGTEPFRTRPTLYVMYCLKFLFVIVYTTSTHYSNGQRHNSMTPLMKRRNGHKSTGHSIIKNKQYQYSLRIIFTVTEKHIRSSCVIFESNSIVLSYFNLWRKSVFATLAYTTPYTMVIIGQLEKLYVWACTLRYFVHRMMN